MTSISIMADENVQRRDVDILASLNVSEKGDKNLGEFWEKSEKYDFNSTMGGDESTQSDHWSPMEKS